jgi:hypothetical protein
MRMLTTLRFCTERRGRDRSGQRRSRLTAGALDRHDHHSPILMGLSKTPQLPLQPPLLLTLKAARGRCGGCTRLELVPLWRTGAHL